MTTINLNSSRDYDIVCGICIGRGYSVKSVRPRRTLFAIRVNAVLSKRQVEFLLEQTATMRDSRAYTPAS